MRAALFVAAAVVIVAAILPSGASAVSCTALKLPNGTTISLSNVPVMPETTLNQIGANDGSFPWSIDPCGQSLCGNTAFIEQNACTVVFPTRTGSATWNTDHIEMVYTSTSSSLS